MWRLGLRWLSKRKGEKRGESESLEAGDCEAWKEYSDSNGLESTCQNTKPMVVPLHPAKTSFT